MIEGPDTCPASRASASHDARRTIQHRHSLISRSVTDHGHALLVRPSRIICRPQLRAFGAGSNDQDVGHLWSTSWSALAATWCIIALSDFKHPHGLRSPPLWRCLFRTSSLSRCQRSSIQRIIEKPMKTGSLVLSLSCRAAVGLRAGAASAGGGPQRRGLLNCSCMCA